MKKTSVVVAHPFLQHAHQLATALHERGLLLQLWSGTPLIGLEEPKPFGWPGAFAERLRRVSIPAALRRHPLWPHVATRVARRLPVNLSEANHRIFHAFDYWFARKLSALRPDVVVAYENSAYYTFKAAKELGIHCVLDASSFHHKLSDRLIGLPQTNFRKKINRQKEAELDMAGHVLACSSLAAQSFIDHGVPHEKTVAIPLGAEIDPLHVRADRPTLNGKLRFVFAGGLRKLKSIDLILEAFERLQRGGADFDLAFVGGCEDKSYLERIERMPQAKYLGYRSQSELFKIFSESDCLLLPSRFDSFGMVVAEAMAYGMPAIVSTMVGAKEIIERHPESGWIVRPEAAAIHDQVKNLIDQPWKLAAASNAAIVAVQDFTWATYRWRVGDFFEREFGR